MTKKIFVGNLSFQTSESELTDLFSQVGQVQSVSIARWCWEEMALTSSLVAIAHTKGLCTKLGLERSCHGQFASSSRVAHVFCCRPE